MKKHLMMSLMLSAVLAAGSAVPFAASETEVQETEADAIQETEKAADVTVTLPDGDAVITNNAGTEIQKAEFTAAADETEAEASDSSASAAGTLALTDAAGKVHTFEETDPSKLNGSALITDDGFLFIRYQADDGSSKLFYESGDEVSFDAPVKKYITNTVYIRSEADADSEAIGVCSLGEEVSALGASPQMGEGAEE